MAQDHAALKMLSERCKRLHLLFSDLFLLYCNCAGFLHAAGLLDLFLVGFILGHLELTFTLDDDTAVFVVVGGERLYSVALPVDCNVSCIDALW